MKKRTLRTLSLIFSSFILIAAILYLINGYLFSWFGFVLSAAQLCEYKSVSVMGDNGYPVPLSFRVDPQYIAQEMSKKENYQVNNRYSGGGAKISRNFDGVNYEIFFQTGKEFNLGTSLPSPRFPYIVGGAKCYTPSYILRDNIFIMIDDLPVTDDQKNEMKNHVWVIPVIHGGFF
jgi:hypothetical protein